MLTLRFKQPTMARFRFGALSVFHWRGNGNSETARSENVVSPFLASGLTLGGGNVIGCSMVAGVHVHRETEQGRCLRRIQVAPKPLGSLSVCAVIVCCDALSSDEHAARVANRYVHCRVAGLLWMHSDCCQVGDYRSRTPVC